MEEERAIDAKYIPTYSFDDEHLEFENVPAGTKWVFIRFILPKTPSLPMFNHFLRDFYEDYPFIRYVDDSHGERVAKDIDMMRWYTQHNSRVSGTIDDEYQPLETMLIALLHLMSIEGCEIEALLRETVAYDVHSMQKYGTCAN